MTKTAPAQQRRHIAITAVILAAVALGFFIISFVQHWR